MSFIRNPKKAKIALRNINVAKSLPRYRDAGMGEIIEQGSRGVGFYKIKVAETTYNNVPVIPRDEENSLANLSSGNTVDMGYVNGEPFVFGLGYHSTSQDVVEIEEILNRLVPLQNFYGNLGMTRWLPDTTIEITPISSGIPNILFVFSLGEIPGLSDSKYLYTNKRRFNFTDDGETITINPDVLTPNIDASGKYPIFDDTFIGSRIHSCPTLDYRTPFVENNMVYWWEFGGSYDITKYYELNYSNDTVIETSELDRTDEPTGKVIDISSIDIGSWNWESYDSTNPSGSAVCNDGGAYVWYDLGGGMSHFTYTSPLGVVLDWDEPNPHCWDADTASGNVAQFPPNNQAGVVRFFSTLPTKAYSVFYGYKNFIEKYATLSFSFDLDASCPLCTNLCLNGCASTTGILPLNTTSISGCNYRFWNEYTLKGNSWDGSLLFNNSQDFPTFKVCSADHTCSASTSSSFPYTLAVLEANYFAVAQSYTKGGSPPAPRPGWIIGDWASTLIYDGVYECTGGGFVAQVVAVSVEKNGTSSRREAYFWLKSMDETLYTDPYMMDNGFASFNFFGNDRIWGVSSPSSEMFAIGSEPSGWEVWTSPDLSHISETFPYNIGVFGFRYTRNACSNDTYMVIFDETTRMKWVVLDKEFNNIYEGEIAQDSMWPPLFIYSFGNDDGTGYITDDHHYYTTFFGWFGAPISKYVKGVVGINLLDSTIVCFYVYVWDLVRFIANGYDVGDIEDYQDYMFFYGGCFAICSWNAWLPPSEWRWILVEPT